MDKATIQAKTRGNFFEFNNKKITTNDSAVTAGVFQTEINLRADGCRGLSALY